MRFRSTLSGARTFSRSVQSAHPAQRLVVGDPREPGREALGPSEVVELRECLHVGFLDDVRGLDPVPQDASGQPEKTPVVTAHDELECRGITRSHPINQAIVREPRGAAATGGDFGLGSGCGIVMVL